MYEKIDDLPPYLEGLNPEQLEAVLNTDGPSLVLAGAGTGKTRVLTTRIAHILLTKKAFPSQILAVTFTNKAAREMKIRIEKTIDESSGSLWLGTFHSIAAKILRRHAEKLNLTSDFIIIDTDDQTRLIKQMLTERGLDDSKQSPKLILYVLGRLKDKAITPFAIPTSELGQLKDVDIQSFYADYQKRLKALNAADFGDLILHNITLFQNEPEILAEYHRRFRYILVDEYQDTNIAQYMWLRLLARGTGNICCVGDDDQSIYGWRGAEIANILRFDKDFPDAKVTRLERNYRSTQKILDAATKLISNNRDRHGKTLWTERTDGNLIKINSFYDEREEARYVAEEIENLKRRKDSDFCDMAILVRAGYQTRSFEEALNFLKIPYRIIGGLKFYERAEIKDVIAYIRVLASTADSLAFERIINLPRRGIGNTTMQMMRLASRDNEISLYTATSELLASGEIKGKAGQSLTKFFQDFSYWRGLLSEKKYYEVVEKMLFESGYIDMWKDEATEQSKERIDNIKELINNLEEFENITEYLEHVSLVTDTDGTLDENRATIMTMHAAKGLEFDTVFLTGWEEGVFPGQKSLDEANGNGLEEERRLAYVGITRAKKNLYISYANNRRIYGSFQPSLPSRFLAELPEHCYEVINSYGTYYKSLSQSLRPSAQAAPSFAPQARANQSTGKAKVGDRVFHIKFGYGRIINISTIFAEVSFDKAGLKKVLIDYLEVQKN